MVNDPALAGLSDPRLARKSAQSRSAEQAKERVLIVQVNFGDLDIEEAIEEVTEVVTEEVNEEVTEEVIELVSQEVIEVVTEEAEIPNEQKEGPAHE